MLFRRTIAVVVPALNEGRHIARVIDTLPPFVDRVVVVDDASTDDTAEQARGTRDPRLCVLSNPQNLGVGGSIARGYAHAFGWGADVAIVMAGDGQMDPSDLFSLIESIAKGADYVKGNRLIWPNVWRDMPTKRLAGNLVLSWLTRRAIGVSVRDSQCGYTAITRDAAAQLDLGALWPRYGYPNDLLARVVATAAKVVEVPVRAVYEDEKSGVGWSDALYVVPSVLARAWLRRWRSTTPVTSPAPVETRPAAGASFERAV